VNKNDNTILWAVISCLLWSTVYAGIKIGLQYDTPLHFAGLRFIISGLILLPFIIKKGAILKLISDNWKIFFWVLLLQVLGNYIFFYLGMDLVPGALGAVIVGSQPLFTALVASLMHESEKLTRNKIITIIAGITGVVMISAGRQAFKFGTVIEVAGVFLIIGANLSTAISNVMVSVRSRGIDPVVLNAVTLFTGGIIILIISSFTENPVTSPKPGEYWLALIWLSIVASTAFSIWYKLLQRPHVKVSELNLWKFIIPVVGAVLSWILVPGENPDILTISGMFIIAVSLIIFFSNGKRINLHNETKV